MEIYTHTYCCNTSSKKKKKKITFRLHQFFLCILSTKESCSAAKMTSAWCATNCCSCTTSVSCTARKKKNGNRVEGCLYLSNWSAENWCLVTWDFISFTSVKAGGTAKCEYLSKFPLSSSQKKTAVANLFSSCNDCPCLLSSPNAVFRFLTLSSHCDSLSPQSFLSFLIPAADFKIS